MKYETVVYGKGWAITVNPTNRVSDVMHYLITGGLLGGRGLEGVTWEEVDNKQFKSLNDSWHKALARG